MAGTQGIVKNVLNTVTRTMRENAFLKSDVKNMRDTKTVPKCQQCEYYGREPLFDGGKERAWCSHWIMESRAIRRRWIGAAEKGKTSPAWCPLRMIRQMMQEEKTMMKRERFQYAGCTLKTRPDVGKDPMTGRDLGNLDFEVEDWFENVVGCSWAVANGNPTALIYALRTGMRGCISLNNDVVYGKIGGLGYAFHVSELVTETA